jgi:histidine ammonia-lyase
VEQILQHVETIVAIELMTAAQGIDFRRQEVGSATTMGRGTAVAYDLIRQKVPFLEHDTVLSPYMEQVRRLVAAGTIKEAVEERLEIGD